jgi:hypothetical protein
VRDNLKSDSGQSKEKLHQLHDLLRDKLGFEHKIAFEFDQADGEKKDA